MFNDTITAISTAVGESAISVIRLSGEEAIDIVSKIFKYKDLNKVESHTINYGYIYEGEEIIDEVLVSIMKSPRTFTRENTVEISCHGGIATTNKILELVLSNGARLAEPGEFTKRAFLNGRIDLAQAESVMDIIRSKTDSSRELAMAGIDGRVSNLITELRQEILEILANIEVNIDYPEYDDVLEMTKELLLPKTIYVKEQIENILKESRSGQIIREGIKTAIVGRPNVGKSSLLNRLMREEKAIVTEIAGTTRDVVEGYINLGGLTLKLIDTAGIRTTENIVEKIGIEKSLKVIDEAELILLVLNNNEELTNDDLLLLEKTKEKQCIIVVNKIDLDENIDRSHIINRELVYISALHNEGIINLENKIKELFNLGTFNPSDYTYISNARHIALLNNTLESINESINGMNMEDPIDMVEIDLKEAWQLLGEILGLEVKEDLINQLFSQFCLGK